jgi:hypothetical protein
MTLEWLALLLCIREVLSSNFDVKTRLKFSRALKLLRLARHILKHIYIYIERDTSMQKDRITKSNFSYSVGLKSCKSFKLSRSILSTITALIKLLSLLKKNKSRQWAYHAVCVSVYHPTNFWMAEPLFMKLGMYIMAPEHVSAGFFINSSYYCQATAR